MTLITRQLIGKQITGLWTWTFTTIPFATLLVQRAGKMENRSAMLFQTLIRIPKQFAIRALNIFSTLHNLIYVALHNLPYYVEELRSKSKYKQVKPGFTNYLPRGLAQKIESFNQKFWKLKKHLQNYSKMSKISEKCGEILTENFKNILNCKKIK